MAKAITIEEAKRKARYGHRDWIFYRGHDGETVCEVCTADALKRALLAVGSSGRFTRIEGSTGLFHSMNWRLGVLMKRNWRFLATRAA